MRDRGARDRAHALAEPHPVTERRGQLLGQRLHPPGREGGHAAHEHPGEQQRVAVGRAAVVLQQHAGEEAVHDPAQQAVDARGVQRRTTVDVGARARGPRPARDRGAGAAAGRPSARARRPPGAAVPTARSVRGTSAGLAQRVPQHAQALLGPRRDAGAEGLQGEGVDVDPAAYGRVGGVEQLEAAVDEEAVDPLGADPPAHRVGGLEHDHVPAGLDQRLRAPQPGEPGSHDHHVGSTPPTLGEAANALRPSVPMESGLPSAVRILSRARILRT